MSDHSEGGAQPVEPGEDVEDVEDAAGVEGGDTARPPAADPTYDLPGDNPLAAEDDDD
jgi:hypothetical protein